MKFLYLCLVSSSFSFTLTFGDQESLCLNYEGHMVPKTTECDNFTFSNIALHKYDSEAKLCWNKDMKGFHDCAKKETDYVELVGLSDSIYGWITRNNGYMKYTVSGKWVKSDFGDRTMVISNTRFFG